SRPEPALRRGGGLSRRAVRWGVLLLVVVLGVGFIAWLTRSGTGTPKPSESGTVEQKKIAVAAVPLPSPPKIEQAVPPPPRLPSRPVQPGKTLFPHEGDVVGVAFSPDGKTLASASSDRVVHVFDLETGVERHNLKGHEGARSVPISPDGRLLAFT